MSTNPPLAARTKAALTANGAATGVLTVASTTGFAKGARVWLNATGVTAKDLEIVKIISSTTMAVRDPATSGTFRYDCSAYTTALSAYVLQNEQVDFKKESSGW